MGKVNCISSRVLVDYITVANSFLLMVSSSRYGVGDNNGKEGME